MLTWSGASGRRWRRSLSRSERRGQCRGLRACRLRPDHVVARRRRLRRLPRRHRSTNPRPRLGDGRRQPANPMANGVGALRGGRNGGQGAPRISPTLGAASSGEGEGVSRRQLAFPRPARDTRRGDFGDQAWTGETHGEGMVGYGELAGTRRCNCSGVGGLPGAHAHSPAHPTVANRDAKPGCPPTTPSRFALGCKWLAAIAGAPLTLLPSQRGFGVVCNRARRWLRGCHHWRSSSMTLSTTRRVGPPPTARLGGRLLPERPSSWAT